MPAVPMTHEAYRLLHDGSIALAEVEANGFKVDLDYLEKAKESTTKTINELESELRADPIFKEWKKRFGANTNLGSRDQLGEIIFGVMGHECIYLTPTLKPATTEEAFDHLDVPFVKKFLRRESLKTKVLGTYLRGIELETAWDGFLRANYNLNIARTYRSSCDDPNMQNMPIRDPELGEIIRRCFIPRRKGWQLVEIDYSGIEVRAAAWYHKDPTMMSYIEDKSKDMHRDMAAEIYRLKPHEVSKHARYCSKNMFVFPQFYGDYYINSAKSLWAAINKFELRVVKEGDDKAKPTGVSLFKRLEKHGIKTLGKCDPQEKPKPGTFEKHLKDIEHHFWNTRFPVYNDWKKKWWKAYLKTGGCQMLSGFHVRGVYGRNDIINYPVQGVAYHCQLKAMMKIMKTAKARGMRSKIVAQIHDSIIADCPKSEVDDFVAMATRIMTVWLPRQWEWISTPLEVETEVSPIGASWHEKKAYKATG